MLKKFSIFGTKLFNCAIVFFFLILPLNSNENLLIIGTITGIRNENIYTIEINENINHNLLKEIRDQHSIIYSINNKQEFNACFEPLFLYHYESKHYLNVLKIPCIYDDLKLLKKGISVVYVLQKDQKLKPVSEDKTLKEIPKILFHPIDKKEMIFVEEDYLLFGQGQNPEDASFNKFYYDWSLENIPKIKSFYIDKYEVTNLEFSIFCKMTQYPCPDFLNKLNDEDKNKPYIYATYKDVESYAKWTNKEIPTEWEWELAAKGGFKEILKQNTIYNAQKLPELPNAKENCNTLEIWKENPQPINVYKLKDVNFRGIVGLCGNALEWTSSYFLPYPGHRFTNKEHQALAGKFFRVLRGGAFYLPVEKAKVYTRIVGGIPTYKSDPIGGFRLILRSQ